MAFQLSGSIVYILLIVLFCGAQARQIRINRYTTVEVPDDDNDDELLLVEVAEVKEVQPTGYPAAGQRPGRTFPLPAEETVTTDASSWGSSTTELPGEMSSTTAAAEQDTTTLYNVVPAELNAEQLAAESARQPKAPYPAAGYRPRIPFNLPSESRVQAAQASATTTEAPFEYSTVTTEEPLEDVISTTATPLAPFTTTTERQSLARAPYPAAGYRPSRVFLLPTELRAAKQVAAEPAEATAQPPHSHPPNGNARHPACGVSTNPLHPAPAKGAQEDPNAERVLVTASVDHAVVTASVPPRTIPVRPLLELRSGRLVAQPFVVAAPGRPFTYSAQYQSW